MKYLITGGCGFVGSNLAAEVLKQNEELFVFDNLYRNGSVNNLTWLKSIGTFEFYHRDIRNSYDVENVIKTIKPDVVFHLAGQVAMTTSIQDPRMDFEVNALGTLNVLEAIRKYSPETAVLYSSTNKVYGDLDQYTYEENELRYICKEYPEGFNEKIPLDFHSPYGCSKGSADQYILDYSRMFNIKGVVFRHSSMYGGRQYATEDQGWIGWFCQKAYDIKSGKTGKPFRISGNGKQVRDVLYTDDLVSCYFKCYKKIDSTYGNKYNIGGGFDNSLSLLELFNHLENKLHIQMNFNNLPKRVSDQKVFIADIKNAKEAFDWKPKITKEIGISKVLEWIEFITEY